MPTIRKLPCYHVFFIVSKSVDAGLSLTSVKQTFSGFSTNTFQNPCQGKLTTIIVLTSCIRLVDFNYFVCTVDFYVATSHINFYVELGTLYLPT